MIIYKDTSTELTYIAMILDVEQDTKTIGVHYYLHDVKAKEKFSLKTPLRKRKNLAPEYIRTRKIGKRTNKFSVPTFHPRADDEPCECDIVYTKYEILAAGFEMDKSSKPGRVNIPQRVLDDIAQFHSAATADDSSEDGTQSAAASTGESQKRRQREGKAKFTRIERKREIGKKQKAS